MNLSIPINEKNIAAIFNKKICQENYHLILSIFPFKINDLLKILLL